MPDTTPFERAQLVYKHEPCLRSFPEDLSLHLHFGWVISTPTVFLMGRPVRHDAHYSQIIDPSHTFDDPDCWFVYLCAGRLRDVFRFLPWPLPFVCWERNNNLRVFPFGVVFSRVGGSIDDTEQLHGFGDAVLEGRSAKPTATTPATFTHDSSRNCCTADARGS